MTLRRAKNIVLLSGAIAIYGAAGGAYLLEKDIYLANYLKMPSISIIETASADTFTAKHNLDFKDFKSLAVTDTANDKRTEEAVTSFWQRLPAALRNIKASFTFEWPELPAWPELPEITIPDIQLPNFVWPEITVPDITLPDLSFQTFMEGSETIERRGQSIAMPEIAVTLQMPRMPSLPSWPDLSLPEFSLPRIEVPGFVKTVPEKIHTLAAKAKGTLADLTREVSTFSIADSFADIAPAAGEEPVLDLASIEEEEKVLFRHGVKKDKKQEESENNNSGYRYAIEDNTLDVEGVLVPQQATVISSSRDGKIAAIHFDNGEMFRKDDILVEYECKDLKAELEIAEAEKDYTQKRTMRHEKLLNLDIISDIDHLGIKTEDIKAAGQAKIIESRMEQCYIRAAYDGRVTNRLANPYEYTRSDRVLMEVASLDDLEIEFLLPSRWLRWVNVGAPLILNIDETDENYSAVIERIHGEVDPVSQSIQISAKLDSYESPLLPGMSGNVHVNITTIREAGIKGFLEEPRYSSADIPPAKP